MSPQVVTGSRSDDGDECRKGEEGTLTSKSLMTCIRIGFQHKMYVSPEVHRFEWMPLRKAFAIATNVSALHC